MRRFTLWVFVVCPFALATAAGAESPSPIVRMGPHFGDRVALVAPKTLESPDWNTPIALTIALPTLGGAEILRALGVAPDVHAPIGFGRTISAGDTINALPLEPGTASVRLLVSSAAASALRVRLTLPAGRFVVWVRGSSDDSNAPSTSFDFAGGAAQTIWTPFTEGDMQDILVESEGVAATGGTLVVNAVSHFVRNPVASNSSLQQKTFPTPGDAAACQTDYACASSTAPANLRAGFDFAAAGVMLMITTRSDGLSFGCSGTLVNSANYPVPYILTANHCVASIETLTTVWKFQRATCGSLTLAPYVQIAGGGVTKASSAVLDAALVVMNRTPPFDAHYAGWDATTVPENSFMVGIHHPQADVKKTNFGTAVGSYPSELTISGVDYLPDTFNLASWSSGIVEPGSSGSGMFTPDANGNFAVRGTLTSGSMGCDASSKIGIYSKLATFFPQIASFLSSKAAATTPVIEYYWATRDHYFISANPAEIAALDAAPPGGWMRTGQSFKSYAQTSATVSPVCRFYIPAAYGDSHYFSASPAECAAVQAKFPVFIYEAPNVFYVDLPDVNTGACPAGDLPVYRLWDNRADTNHRYTTSLNVRNAMLALGYVSEGYGPNLVSMCSPP